MFERMNRKNLFFYFLSFLEGASVMAAELLGAKMLSPYFGTSLYVWSSVLGVTLGGLALGYFTGGILSAHAAAADLAAAPAGMNAEAKKINTERNLYYVLLASAIFLILMPFLAREVMLHTVRFDLVTSILISSLIFLFPPVFFMGMVSPLIVQCLAAGNPGKAAGSVYAVSTLGGIIATFLLGFYIIPEFGLTRPAVIIGIFLGIIPFIYLIRLKIFASLFFLLVIFFSWHHLKSPATGSGVKKLYSSEGLLGQIIVADYPGYGSSPDESQRMLFLNRSTQTMVTVKNGEKSFFEYVHLISRQASDSLFPDSATGLHALVLGLGGGSVANELVKNNFRVDAVELDTRMAYVAKTYFDLSAKVNVYLDDARHFVRERRQETVTTAKYDLIVLDAFVGEVNPHHLFTEQFFSEIKLLLSDRGAFFINGNGYWNGTAGKGMRSVCKTLLRSGFDVDVCPTRDEEDFRNLVFVSKKSNTPYGTARSRRMALPGLDDAVILTDDKPQLEILNAEANMRWRKSCMKYFMSGIYSGQEASFFN